MTDDGYVHDPDAFEEGASDRERDDPGDDGREPGSGETDSDRQSGSTRADAGEETDRYPRNTADPGDQEFDWRGWTLVGVVVFAFLVVPGALYVLPAARAAVASLGLSLRDTYLVLPLLPAFLLGAVAVWSAVRSRSR